MSAKRGSKHRRPSLLSSRSMSRRGFSRQGRFIREPLNRRLWLEQLEDRRLLAVFTVSNLDDMGSGSLRDAIAMANSTAGADEVQFSTTGNIALATGHLEITETLTITGPGQDSLTIDAQQNSRIFYTSGPNIDFTISGLTLTGGQTTASGVSGRGGAIRSRYFGTLTIEDSTITGNSTIGASADGGAIQAGGDVVLIRSVVSDSYTSSTYADGGGIFASSNVTLIDSTVSGNSTALQGSTGGGIYSEGNVTLSSSILSGNSTTGSSSSGGGIYTSSGNVTLTSSTLSGNSTTGSSSSGGGIRTVTGNVTLTGSTLSGNSNTGSTSSGGAIRTATGAVTLISSTLSGNSTISIGGGIRTSSGAVTLIGSTLSGNRSGSNGGGIYFRSTPINPTLTIQNSIVAGNTVAAGSMGPDVLPDPGGIFDVDYSLIGDTSGSGITAGTGTGNRLDVDPLLGPLAFNGGRTQTHALLSGSPAISRGDPTLLPNPAEFDQRGDPFLRVVNVRVDMGAYERQTVAGLNLEVDTTVDELDTDFSAGDLSLREAIGLANGSIGANTITFDPTAFGTLQTIALEHGEIEITDTAAIDGPGPQLLTINAGQQSRIIDSSMPDVDVTIRGLTLTGGRTSASGVDGRGGAINSPHFGTLAIENSVITANSTANDMAEGGGIFAGGNVTLTDSTVSGNSTTGDDAEGGGIRSSSVVTLVRSTISGNSTGGTSSVGGGIRSFRVMLTDSTISGNSTTGILSNGGGIYTNNSVTLVRSTVSGNRTTGDAADGGGIFSFSAFGSLTATQSTITNNHTEGVNATGGGVWNQNGPITIDGSIVAENTDSGGISDFDPGTGTFSVNYSLIGASGLIPDPETSDHNLVTNDAMLGSLASNGGPTETHAPLVGSIVINFGDQSITFNPTEFDQRGAPFARVVGGRIDIGAVEVQPIADSADFDSDGDVDGADFLAWQRGLGTPNADQPDGDANNDDVVDAIDLGIWESQFGNGAPLIELSAASSASLETGLSANLIDAALVTEWLGIADEDEAESVAREAAVEAVYTFSFQPDWLIPTARDSELTTAPPSNSDSSNSDEQPWLADELLERVFG